MRMLEVFIEKYYYFKIIFALFLLIMFGCFFVNLLYINPSLNEIITGMIVPYIPSKALSPVFILF